MNRLLFFAFTLSLTVCAQTKSTIDDIHQIIQKKDIEGHIYFLADDLLKGRETGTPENKIAASYLANTLRSYGVQPNPKSGNYYQVGKELNKTWYKGKAKVINTQGSVENLLLLSEGKADVALTQGDALEFLDIFYSSSACMYPEHNQLDPDNPNLNLEEV